MMYIFQFFCFFLLTGTFCAAADLYAQTALSGYELIGAIDGTSGFKGGKKGVVMLKSSGKSDAIVVAVGSVIPGTAYTVAEIEAGKAIVRDRSGQSYSIAKDPFSGGGSSVSAIAGSVDDVSSDDDMSDIANYHNGREPEQTADAPDPGDRSNLGSVATAPEPVVDTPHYSVQPGQEEEFLKRRQAFLNRQGAADSANGSVLSNTGIPAFSNPPAGDDAGESGSLPAFERIRRRADRTGLSERLRRFGTPEEADRRVPRG